MDVGGDLGLILRLGLALALGAAIGLERELQREAAGFRTHALVALGAALFTVVSYTAFDTGDPARIAAQVVTGIGFIGGGAILRSEKGVRGLTTAASLWGAGAIGMAAGAGLATLAVAGTVLAIFALEVLDRLEELLIHRRRGKQGDRAEP